MPKMNAGNLEAGQIFHGRYEIVRCLKTGGMGAVYECIHLKTRKRRALKVMLPEIVADPSMHERFELEARVTADIESEHIVETFDAGVDEETGAPFLVMELLRGEELGSLLKRRGALPVEEVVLLLAQAARALDRTHAAGIVHRDLKPDNFFVTMRDDDTPRLKILDFGIAKVIADRSGAIKQTAAIGTPLYMSPEQFQGDGAIGPRADIYALGHIAYALLTGRPYWHDEQRSNPAIFAFCVMVMNGPHELPTARAARRGVVLPSALDIWFARATARRPVERFSSASTLVTELARALGISTPRFSMGSLPTLSPEPTTAQGGTLSEALSAAPTKQLLKVTEGSRTIVDSAPPEGMESATSSPELNLTNGSSVRHPLIKAPRGRSTFVIPASVLVIGIGLMVLVKFLQGGFKNKGSGNLQNTASIVLVPAPTPVPLPEPPVASSTSGPPASAAPTASSAPSVQPETAPVPPPQSVPRSSSRPPAVKRSPVVPDQVGPDDPYGSINPSDVDDSYGNFKSTVNLKPSEVKVALRSERTLLWALMAKA